MRRVRPLLLLAAVALLATGCFRSDLAVEVNDDGSGRVTMVVAFNPEAMGELGEQLGEEAGEALPEDPCEQIEADIEADTEGLPEGASVEPYRDGDFCGVTVGAEFGSVEELDTLLGGLFSSSESQGFASFDTFTIDQEGDNWVFAATPSASATSGGEDVSMFGHLLEGASNVVRIKLPGRQVDHNADRIDDDGTMIWNLDVLGDTRTLQARTEPGEPITDETLTDAGEDVAGSVGGGASSGDDDGGSSTVWIVLGVLVVAAAVVGFLLWKRNQSKTAPAIAGGPGAPGTTTTFGAGGYGPDAYGAPAGTPPGAEPTVVSPPQATTPATGQPDATAGGPQWDAQRNAYIQWDPEGGRWLQYDDAAKEWKPIG